MLYLLAWLRWPARVLTAVYRGRAGLRAVLLAMLAAGAGRAGAAGTWNDMADVIFRPIGLSTDAPSVLLPTAIAQDAAGFLWVGGESGLARWDGYRYRLYSSDGQPDGLTDHNILALQQDRAGRLWVGTVGGGLARYDLAADRFVPVPLRNGAGAAVCVWSIAADKAGGVWVGTSTGVFRLDAAGRVIGSLHHRDGDADSLPQDRVESVLLDRQGVLWVGGGFGVARGRAGNTRFDLVALPAAGTPDISHMMEDGAGRLWFGSRQFGAFMIGPQRGAAVAVPQTQARPGEAAAAEILAMAEIAPDQIWLGTYGGGIVELDGATLRARRVVHDPLVPASLAANTVSALYADRSGLAWVGTSVGISLFDPGSRGILTLWGDADRTDGLRVRDASAVLARADGSLWVGSEGDGVQVLDGPGPGRLVDIKRVFALGAGPRGPVYVGSRSGLYAVDPSTLAVTHLTLPRRDPAAAVNALLVQDGAVWMGGGSDGLWELLPGQGGDLTVALHLDRPILTNGATRAIAWAPDGRLAVGTDRGFNLVDAQSGAVERVLPDPDDPEGLSAGAVMSFATDRLGRLWVGTDSTGIDVLIGRDAAGRPRFAHIGRAQGLPNDDVSRMLVDRTGMIWASTDVGLATIDPDSFKVRALRTLDGVVVPTYWSNSGDITPQGDLVFGGVGGLCIVQPALVRQWRFRPPVVITSVTVGGRVLPGGFGADGQAAAVRIPPDDNSLSVEFAALDFSAPDLNRYAYRLEPFDRGWVYPQNGGRLAAYTNLPPGRYRLHLRGSNRNGAWSERDDALRIVVLPAWYQTVWFRIAAGLMAAGMIGGLVQARTLYLRRQQRVLERLVAERTAELSLSQEKLQRFAYFDSLTGLPNRRAFNEQFQALASAEPARPFALILVDLDGFKQVNDSLGHLAGDALLVSAAVRLRQAIRDQDFVARLGGDEFAVLVGWVENDVPASTVCARIVTSMAEPVPVRGVPVLVGASAGVALFPQDGRTLDELYRHVDAALYEAKRAGRGVWRFYRGGLGAAASPG
jgi:diguanylate cyclase (GGDEF)-like protein